MHRKIRVIIVDDEARLRRGVERLVLKDHDAWEVVGSYSSGQECFEAVYQEKLPFDLLITDVKMPVMDGLTLIKKLKETTNFHSMVISGFDDFQFLQTAIREGASDYLIKPINREEFATQLSKIKEVIIAQWQDLKYREENETKANQLTYVKQTQLLSEITWKKDIDLSSLDWTKDFPKGYYQLMYVSLDHLKHKSNSFQHTDLNSWEASIDIICNEILDEWGLSPSWRWKGEDLSLWLLCMHDPDINQGQCEESEKSSIHFADKLRKSIKDITPFTCSVAISEPVDDLTLLPIVKDELLTYMQFRILYGGNQLFSKERVERWRSVKKTNDNKELEHQINKIIFSLDSKNQENTKTEVATFLGLLQKLPSPEEMEKTIYSLGIQIVNYLLKNTLLKDEYISMKEVFGLTSKSTNFYELKQEVYEWVKKVLLTLEERNLTQNADQIELAKNWILTNLDQNITIQKIASHVYMNPTYFSEYFKTQTGETVLDFVTRIRIEKARELLLSTDLKIYDISEKVGYSDTKHFSKLFKRQYGETPSKYKEKIILEHR